jgi:hypothetical protein
MRAAVACVALALALGYTPDVRPHAATSNTVLFDREIVRILDEHCVMCHAEGGPSFPLSTYEQTWLTRDAILREVIAQRMPPWPAVDGYGTFANANALTLRETRFIVSWVEGLGPRNAGAVFLNTLAPAGGASEVEATVDFTAFRLGEPDWIASVPAATRPIESRASTALSVRRAIVDARLETQRRVRALEFRPADSSAIHAAVFSLEQTGQWLMTWTPWYGARELPSDSAFTLPAGARIVVDVYTARDPVAAAEVGRLALHDATSDRPREPFEIVLEAAEPIPARAERHRLHEEIVLANDVEVLALWPEVPAGIDSLEVSARRTDGTVQVLVFARDVPAAWPTPFVLAEPVALSRGSRVSLIVYASNASETALQERARLVVSAVAPAVAR